jgi:hypothetical protein
MKIAQGICPKSFMTWFCRLSFSERARPRTPTSATAHGLNRRGHGYPPAMLVEESRVLQVLTFHTLTPLHHHRHELDHEPLLLDITIIADEVDWQLTQAMTSLTEPNLAKPAA